MEFFQILVRFLSSNLSIWEVMKSIQAVVVDGGLIHWIGCCIQFRREVLHYSLVFLPTSICWDDDCTNSIRSGWDAFGSSYQSGWKFDEPSSSRGKREWGERDDYRDVVDRLPSDPFGMNLETTFTSAISGWIGDVRIISNDYQMGVNQLDPADLLPSDPFGMNLETSFTVAIAGWIGDFRAILGDYQLSDGNDLFAGLSYYCNNALLVPSTARLNCEGRCDGRGSSFEPVVNLEVLSSSNGPEIGKADCDEIIPHDGLLYVLSYLDLQDRLSAKRVCKTLRSAILNDPLLRRCIHIHYELGDKLTDDGLVRLTQKAQGNLQCLSVVGCPKITDDGLRRVLENCLNLSKARIGKLPENWVKFVRSISGWTATLLFMWMPIAQMWTTYLNPDNIKGLSALTILLGMIGNALMIPRALFIRDLMWFTGASWASILHGWGNLACMYFFNSISSAFFFPATLCLFLWMGAALWRDTVVYKYNTPLKSLKDLAFGR